MISHSNRKDYGMRVAILIITLLYYALVINAFTPAAGKRRHIQYHNSQIIAKSTSSCDDDTSEDVMIIFRSPSHHTYGFIQPNNTNKYDLPMVELQNLINDDEHDIRFIPINNDLQSTHQQPKQLSRNQSKKKKKDVYKHEIPLMYWVKNSTGDTIDHTIIAKATSHSILTHSAFAINKYYNISDEVWRDAVSSSTTATITNNDIDQVDIIDMGNPNMSNHDRTDLIQRIANFIEYNQHLQCIDDVNKEEGRQPIIIHDIIHQQQNNEHIHQLYFGYRLSIGLAGTTGAPSRTLRRTNRGILKKYALKNRVVESDQVAYDTSTAMEPEIGFLMINLALAGRDPTSSSSRVLDPCCGSGRLLLYAAASGVSKLVGVDYNQNVYRDAGLEFERYNFAPPIFIQGNVQSPMSTDVLCTLNSFDAIVCDPPYGIGAPILSGDTEKGEESINKESESRDIISSIISIANNVLVKEGRLVFLLPVQGDSMSIPLEKLLQLDLEKSNLCLLKSSSRLQRFSPTFARWLVCMEKC